MSNQDWKPWEREEHIRTIQRHVLNLATGDTFFHGPTDEIYPKGRYYDITGRIIGDDIKVCLHHIRSHVKRLELDQP